MKENIVRIPLPAASGHAHLAHAGPEYLEANLSSGRSLVLVGANGSGKTRLGAFLENSLGRAAHRIAAQRSLRIAAQVTLSDYDTAINQLHAGHAHIGADRNGNRWHGDPYVSPLEDTEFLLRALFAEQNRALVLDHNRRKQGEQTDPPQTKLDVLYSIWSKLLPNRSLNIKDASIEVLPPKNPNGTGGDSPYSPSQMSDGERVVFYLIGQCVLAPENGVVIIDEPELHIHPSISASLWDEVEAIRSDCAFVYITHDVEFAASRIAAQKLFVRGIHYNNYWDVESIPEGTGLPESLVIQLVGNRKSVLFVEGAAGSLDLLIYRSVYPDLRVEPCGPCEGVIHSVVSFRANATLHRLGLVYGCVDRDHRSADQLTRLSKNGIETLQVAEIENVLLLPEVFLAIASSLAIPSNEAVAKLEDVTKQIISKARSERENVTARFLSRRLDERLKTVTVNTRSLSSLKSTFAGEIASIDLEALECAFKQQFDAALASNDLPELLALFDQKGLLDYAARQLGLSSGKGLAVLVSRLVVDVRHASLRGALEAALPRFTTSTDLRLGAA